MQPLVRLENVDVALNGKVVLRGITWDLLPRQHWAIVGRNGSGKSTLLKLIRGELGPAPGRGKRTYFLDGREQTPTAVGVRERISVVSPELHERYLQMEWQLTAGEVVLSGLGNTDYVYGRISAAQRAEAARIADLLEIEDLLKRNVQRLSTGQLRKVLIARALVGRPAILALDEVCDGLDVSSRETLLGAVDRLARSGVQVLYATHRPEEFIPSLTDLLKLEEGQITHRAPMSQERGVRPSSGAARPARDAAPRMSAGLEDAEPAAVGRRILIDVCNANVYLERKRVLRDINWTLRANEHWAILGPNGAGKSTFLKLIAGDLHPAVGGAVRRWNFTPGSTLWDIRRRLGFLSPELQANYRDSSTAEEVIASGFFGSIGLRRKPARAQRLRVVQLMAAFDASHLAGKCVGALSYGEFRKILLLRALVHEPQLLLCDEPFDGLDLEARRAFREALERVARRGTQLLVVTHHTDELPRCLNRTMVLEGGEIKHTR